MLHHLAVFFQNGERIESGCNLPSKTERQLTRNTEEMRTCTAVQQVKNQQNPDMQSMMGHPFLKRQAARRKKINKGELCGGKPDLSNIYWSN